MVDKLEYRGAVQGALTWINRTPCADSSQTRSEAETVGPRLQGLDTADGITLPLPPRYFQRL